MKASEEIGVKYMQEWEEKIYELREAKEEGLAVGIKALVQDNLEEGVSAERIIGKLRKRFGLDEQKAKEFFEHFSSER